MPLRSMTRRDFMKLCGISAAGVSVAGNLEIPHRFSPLVVQTLERAAEGNPPVIWLQGSGCTGCSVSLLNSVYPDVANVLLNIISLRYHPTVMAATGEQALAVLEQTARDYRGEFILVVEGAIPTAAGGLYGTFGENDHGPETILERTVSLGKAAKAVVALGTCAAYGGIPAAAPNPSGAKAVSEVIGAPTLNIPGCPPHPDWIVGTLAHVLMLGMPELDEFGRPVMFYGDIIHENCQFYQDFQKENFARHLGDDGCLVFLGCKGPVAHSDCYERHWNNGVNWCIGSGAPCIGCTQPDFPDGVSPFYARLPDEKLDRRLTLQRYGVKTGVVPDVVGLREVEARRIIEEAGLVASPYANYQGAGDIPRYVRSQVSIGCVVSTDPPFGTNLGQGGAVKLAVRKN